MFENENELNTYHIDCPSEQGILYLFPSYIEHEALPTQAEHRYVLSFNTDYKLIGKRSV
jgi:hypothetical protein